MDSRMSTGVPCSVLESLQMAAQRSMGFLCSLTLTPQMPLSCVLPPAAGLCPALQRLVSLASSGHFSLKSGACRWDGPLSMSELPPQHQEAIYLAGTQWGTHLFWVWLMEEPMPPEVGTVGLKQLPECPIEAGTRGKDHAVDTTTCTCLSHTAPRVSD
jgi:hypothetical protein